MMAARAARCDHGHPMTNLLLLLVMKAVLLAAAGLVARRLMLGTTVRPWVALPVGAAFGFLFHLVFHDRINAIGFHAEPTTTLIAVNAVLSYGLTAMTVALVPLHLADRSSDAGARGEWGYFATTLVAALLAAVFAPTEFTRALGAGAALMLGLESLALVLGHRGPIARMLQGDLRGMGVLFVTTVVLGALYECLNLLFPVWVWTSLDAVPTWLRLTLMIGGGYVVLIHPLLMAIRLVEARVSAS